MLLSLAALLFAGCSKSDMQKQTPAGEDIEVLETVTFTAAVPDNSAVQTKAAFEPKEDGKAASTNRCIIEIYYNNKLFKRDIQPVNNKTASFSFQMPANRTYDVLFWADYVEDITTSDGLATDKYYKTNSDDGLKNVAMTGTYVGNDDKRDAFFYYESCTIAQGGTSKNFTLKRPFSQINVYTTDVKYFATATDAIPEKVDVTLKNPYTSINVMTGALGDQVSTINYNTSLYDFPDPDLHDLTAVAKAKLSMDYVFATTEQANIDITWKAQPKAEYASISSEIVHEFTSIPYARNYRTNIIGDLLTAIGSWNVTIDASWTSEIQVVSDISSANSLIAEQASAGVNPINIKFKAEPTDAGVPGSGGHAILTTPLQDGTVLNIEVEADTKALYVGDYESEDGTALATSGLESAVVNINVPAGKTIETLVINAPTKTVYLNGAQLASAGTITNLDASTAANTLIVNAGQTVTNLTMHQGGLEIHGTVTSAAVSETAHSTNPVQVRACEGLNASVYNALKGYIASGYEGIKVSSDPETWDIVVESLTKYVANTEQLLSAITWYNNREYKGTGATPDSLTIILSANDNAYSLQDVVIKQEDHKKLTIMNKDNDAVTLEYSGTSAGAENGIFLLQGYSEKATSDMRIVFKGLKFKSDKVCAVRLVNCNPYSQKRYPHDIKFDNCVFEITSEDYYAVYNSDGGDNAPSGIFFYNCHLTQGTKGFFGGYANDGNYEGYAVKLVSCTAENCVHLMNYQNSKGNIIISNGEFSNTEEYMVRTNGATITVTDSDFTCNDTKTTADNIGMFLIRSNNGTLSIDEDSNLSKVQGCKVHDVYAKSCTVTLKGKVETSVTGTYYDYPQ